MNDAGSPSTPTFKYLDDKRHLVIWQYTQQDIESFLPLYSPRSLLVQGKHLNLKEMVRWTELIHLDVRNTNETDFVFLSQLRLENLLLSHAGISDLTHVTQIPTLRSLSLWSLKRLKDLTLLGSSSSVESLSLFGFHGVKYPDFTAMQGLGFLELDCCSGLDEGLIQNLSNRIKVHLRKVKYR